MLAAGQGRYVVEMLGRQIQDRQFGSARRGYDRSEVDAFLGSMGDRVSALEEQLRTAEVRAASSDEELAQMRQDIDTMLQEATDARRKIIDEAKAEATIIAAGASTIEESAKLGGSAATAAAIISEAETAAAVRLQTSEQAREAAHEDAARIVREAEVKASATQAEADRLLDKARIDARSVREATESVRSSMDVQLAEIRLLLEEARVRDAEFANRPSSGLGNDAELVVDLRGDATQPDPHHAAG